MANNFNSNTINDLIAESVYGPAGENTQPCANAWEVSKLIAGLHARIQILENRLGPPDSNPQVNEPSSLDYKRQAAELVARIQQGRPWQSDELHVILFALDCP
jgi:hypothetical protein